MDLTIVSMNIEGTMSNKVCIREVISKYNPDIICIQEHWLFNFEQNEADTIHPMYYAVLKRVDDIDPISPRQRPRGYG